MCASAQFGQKGERQSCADLPSNLIVERQQAIDMLMTI
jgi:hypothetical protein